jgi:hypothetical protein
LLINFIQSETEVEVIKGTLKKLFGKVLDARKDGKQSVHSFFFQNTSINQRQASLYPLFVDIISADMEVGFDLLAWSIETYTNMLLPPQKSKKPGATGPSFGALLEFIVILLNHFQATPPLVRYGSAVSLHSAVTINEAFLSENKQFHPFIVSGALDSDYLTSFIYITLLPLIQTGDGKNLETLVKKYQDTRSGNITYDMRNAPNTNCMMESRTILSEALECAVTFSSPLQTKQLQKLINSLEFMTKQQKLRQMEIIRIWCGRSEHVNHLTIKFHNLITSNTLFCSLTHF